MDLFTNILFLCVTIMFFGIYVFNFVLNIVRAKQTNKLLKQDPQKIEGTVTEIVKTPKRVYIRVRHKSETNNQTFETIFELTPNEFKDQYYENQQVEIIYPKISGNKKIHCFPVYLSGTKLSVEAGPIFTDGIMMAAGLFIFLFSLYNMLQTGAFKGNVPLIASDASQTSSMNWLSLLMFLMIYFVLLSYLLERLTGISSMHSQNYLKICGEKTRAEVITYKLNKSKNEKGVRQSEIKIEFSTKQGEQIQTQILSFIVLKDAFLMC